MNASAQSRVQYHREWLHVLEDDPSVPDYALFTARVYADFSGISRSPVVQVRWSALQRMTHMHNDKIARALRWLSDHGWLKEEGSATRGQRVSRRLMIPVSALPPQSAPEGRSTPDPGSEYSGRSESEYSEGSESEHSGRSEHEQQEQQEQKKQQRRRRRRGAARGATPTLRTPP